MCNHIEDNRIKVHEDSQLKFRVDWCKNCGALGYHIEGGIMWAMPNIHSSFRQIKRMIETHAKLN